MANTEFKNITSFVDVVAAENDEYVTKVRVSLDNGNTWGTLYSIIFAEFKYIDYPNYSNSPLVIPYDAWDVTYNIVYDICEDINGYDSTPLAQGLTIPFNFSLSDCSNGWNDFTILVEYKGKSYELNFVVEIEIQEDGYDSGGWEDDDDYDTPDWKKCSTCGKYYDKKHDDDCPLCSVYCSKCGQIYNPKINTSGCPHCP